LCVSGESADTLGMTEIIRAEIVGSNICQCDGHVVRANAPVLGLCRKLVEAGYDPARPLHAYRGDVLCLRIRSIGEGAKLNISEKDRDGLQLVPWRAFPSTPGASRIDESEGEAGIADT
jgi:hypothetical protein